MKKYILSSFALATVSFAAQAQETSVAGLSTFEAPSRHTLWYNQPAPTSYAGWQEYSLPIGNGELGGSVFGGVKTDKFTFNEKSLWAGNSETRPNPNHGEYLKFGSLWVTDLSGNFDAGVKDYVRYLDIDHGVAGVSFTDAAGTKYTRTYVTSASSNVIAIRYTAEGPNTLSLRFSVTPGAPMVELSEVKPEVTYHKQSQFNAAEASFEGKLELLSYAANISVSGAAPGSIKTDAEGITVEGGHDVVVYIAGGTDYDGTNTKTFTDGSAVKLHRTMLQRTAQAQSRGWENIYADHTDHFGSLMGRVDLNLGGATKRNTQDLIEHYADEQANRDGAEGLFLEELYYQYGRYLCVASNGKRAVPNNLQGLWNDTDRGHAPWNSDIHTNINIQMNYWPTENANLSELHLPLLDYITNIAQSPGCLNQAKRAGQSVGWVVNTESNLFGGMSSWSDNYTIANAWYATHLWTHYRYTLDSDYLRRVFPAMWSAAQYWAERLVLAEDGTYECPNEFSPEQGPQRENATAHSQQLVCELFSNTLDAIKVLGNEAELDAAWLEKIRDRYAKADRGLHIETYDASAGWGEDYIKYGTPVLREWKYSPYSAGQNAHRHTSHLMALYPFSQIQPGAECFEPAVASLTQRTDASTGWAMGWRVNLWARALDGNHARRMINNALFHAGHAKNTSPGGIYYNLWDAHTPFQIDGNFGVCAGIGEMLLQSKYEVASPLTSSLLPLTSSLLPLTSSLLPLTSIRLLPALPDGWKDGSVSGLKAEGNCTVDETWAKGQLKKAVITSHAGTTLRLQYGYNAKTRRYAFDKTIATTPGQVITVTFSGKKGKIVK